MDDNSNLLGTGFDDPTKIEAKPAPAFFKTLIGLSLLTCALSFGSYVWEAKWGNNDWSKKGAVLKAASQKSVDDIRWGWKPYRLEYQLYVDRGYDLRWLEQSVMQKTRKTLGIFAPFFELFILRLYGAITYFIPAMIMFLFFLSMGSVHYHNKRFHFKHVSSTFNNASIKVFFWGLPLILLWAMFPFGVNLPVLGEMPVLASSSGFGTIWVSSPLIAACVFGSLLSLVAYILGANFSREI